MEGLTAYTVVLVLALAIVVSAEKIPHEAILSNNGTTQSTESYNFFELFNFLRKKSDMHYHHFWPELEFGWRVIVGSVIGFFGAAFGSVGGVGGGGIFVPMLTLIIGFDPKTSTAISKFASTKAFFKGVETSKKETTIKKEAVRRLTSNVAGGDEVAYKIIPGGPNNGSTFTNEVYKATEVSIFDNMYWKDISRLIAVWIVMLALHISKVPVAVGASAYEAVCLYKGSRMIMSSGEIVITWKVHQLIVYCCCGILSGIVGGLLGLGGGFILGPLFLDLEIPPQVSSATAAFVMIFSSSMSVIQYYLLRRFPVPYALYFIAVASIAALVGQHVVRRIISLVGRASVIIFILAFTIFVRQYH